MIGIYKITNPSGKVYVGQSRNITKRITAYKNGYHKGQPKLHNSFIKYGFSKHTIEIIYEFSENVEQNILDKVEIFYIKFYKSLNISLNVSEMARGYGKMSEETKLKLSITKTGKYSGEKNPNFGRKHTDATKKSISDKAKSRNIIISKSNREALNKAVCKKCYQFTKDGYYIKTYNSVTEAAKTLGVNCNVISNHIRGGAPTAYGYIWKYNI